MCSHSAAMHGGVSTNRMPPTGHSHTTRAPDPSGELLDVFKALGHPIRFEIMRRMMHRAELPCTELEAALPIAKSTISYHIKLLHRAGLVNVRKAGRYYYYTPRREHMEEVLPGMAAALDAAAD